MIFFLRRCWATIMRHRQEPPKSESPLLRHLDDEFRQLLRDTRQAERPKNLDRMLDEEMKAAGNPKNRRLRG